MEDFLCSSFKTFVCMELLWAMGHKASNSNFSFTLLRDLALFFFGPTSHMAYLNLPAWKITFQVPAKPTTTYKSGICTESVSKSKMLYIQDIIIIFI